MNMYTPGPWIIHGSEIRPVQERPKDRRMGLVTTIVTADTDLDGYGDQLANLQLIAAAPDLLAALEAAEYRLAAMTGPRVPEILEQMRAAIAKARGKS